MLKNKMQIFMDADGGADGGAGAGQADNNQQTNQQGDGDNDANKGQNAGQNTHKTLDELLASNKDYQSEIDRRINKAVETATANERERQQIIQDNLQDEVLRVSKMTQTEKEAYFKQKQAREQAQKEADLLKRELTLDARGILQERKLPDAFVDLLDYSNKDACKKSIDVLDAAFADAVQKAVDDKLKGTKPPKDAGTEGTQKTSADAQEEKVTAEIREIMGLRTKK